MEYALIYDKKNNQYHIYKSSRKNVNINDKKHIHNNYLCNNIIDIKINKYPLCKEDIIMNDLCGLEKHELTFTPEKYYSKIYNPNQYYLISKFRDIKGKEYPSIYAERKIIMIFLDLFEEYICPKCFLEFINELKNK